MMKTELNNLYHDNMKRFNGFLFGVFDNIAHYFEGRRMYHDVRHVQTEKDKKEMSEWFDNFKKQVHENAESDKKTIYEVWQETYLPHRNDNGGDSVRMCVERFEIRELAENYAKGITKKFYDTLIKSGLEETNISVTTDDMDVYSEKGEIHMNIIEEK